MRVVMCVCCVCACVCSLLCMRVCACVCVYARICSLWLAHAFAEAKESGQLWRGDDDYAMAMRCLRCARLRVCVCVCARLQNTRARAVQSAVVGRTVVSSGRRTTTEGPRNLCLEKPPHLIMHDCFGNSTVTKTHKLRI